MKGWCQLSWREKTRIADGEVNPMDYLYGYEFQVKEKVKEGQEKKEYMNGKEKD